MYVSGCYAKIVNTYITGYSYPGEVYLLQKCSAFAELKFKIKVTREFPLRPCCNIKLKCL